METTKSTFVEPHMKAGFAHHELELLEDGKVVKLYKMATPGTGHLAMFIVEIPSRIVLTGDLIIGADRKGVESDWGYNLNWFGSELSERYLCEKFLSKGWEPRSAAEWCRDYADSIRKGEVEKPATVAAALDDVAEKLEGATSEWTTDRCDIALADAGVNMWEDFDEFPGWDYNWTDAGFLCALQQRFRELYHKE